MVTFKNIRIKKPGGGTRLQRVKVLASGKYRFVKNKPAKSRSTKTKTTKKRSVKRMGKKKKRNFKKTIPLAPLGGFAAGLVFAAPQGYDSPFARLQAGDMGGFGRMLLANLTGIRISAAGRIDPVPMMNVLNPFDFSMGAAWKMALMGGIIHKIANWVGVNRQFQRLPGFLSKLRI